MFAKRRIGVGLISKKAKTSVGGLWCWVPWMDYVFNGGKDAPCKDEPE